MGRIIFPITDQRGATVGFGGRAIDRSSQAKYINSPDSVTFNKRRVLFGLKQLRILNDTVFVVEGYFDVMTLHQASFKNTVGLLGTQLSAEQTRILETLARNAILIFDGDPGGQAALLRCLKVPRHNLTVKAAILPESDPDEIVREGRTAEFEALIEKAKPLREAAIEIITRRKETENIEQLADEIIRLGAEIPDAVEASSFIDEASEVLNLPAWALRKKPASGEIKGKGCLNANDNWKNSLCTNYLHIQVSFLPRNWNRSKTSSTTPTINKSCLTRF